MRWDSRQTEFQMPGSVLWVAAQTRRSLRYSRSAEAKKRPGFPGRFGIAMTPGAYFRFEATKSQLTRFQNASTYFGRALR
ncbi:hypothetical protein [Lysobacter gummosus]|uniref:hypothetical protein n=1 Tax=Lysobacter gummosus TaxID=262324 RepID=UPI00362CE581